MINQTAADRIESNFNKKKVICIHMRRPGNNEDLEKMTVLADGYKVRTVVDIIDNDKVVNTFSGKTILAVTQPSETERREIVGRYKRAHGVY